MNCAGATTSGHLKQVFKAVTACLHRLLHLLLLQHQLPHLRQLLHPHRLLPQLLRLLQSLQHQLLCQPLLPPKR